MPDTYQLPKEGDLYMRLNLYGYTFELRYGYYEDIDRERGEPVAIYPDLISEPVFTSDGYPLVTAVQSPCEYYQVTDTGVSDECCSDCIYYKDCRNEIDICLNEKRRKQANGSIPVQEEIENERVL